MLADHLSGSHSLRQTVSQELERCELPGGDTEASQPSLWGHACTRPPPGRAEEPDGSFH